MSQISSEFDVGHDDGGVAQFSSHTRQIPNLSAIPAPRPMIMTTAMILLTLENTGAVGSDMRLAPMMHWPTSNFKAKKFVTRASCLIISCPCHMICSSCDLAQQVDLSLCHSSLACTIRAKVRFEGRAPMMSKAKKKAQQQDEERWQKKVDAEKWRKAREERWRKAEDEERGQRSRE